MANRGQKKHQAKLQARRAKAKAKARSETTFQQVYDRACRLAEDGQPLRARRDFEDVLSKAPDTRRRALLRNDLAALAALAGETDKARKGFQEALALDHQCEPARANLAFLDSDLAEVPVEPAAPREKVARIGNPSAERRAEVDGLPIRPTENTPAACERTTVAPAGKVAILSFLFNWPSQGGGIVHTAELAKFLGRGGYEVRHFYAKYAPWGIGVVAGTVPFGSEALEFDDAAWTIEGIQARYRQAVDAFGPDWVVVMDSWNFKPHLAEAMRGYPTFLRFQALECLCPLNNVRLLVDGQGRFIQCPKHQLATPEGCCACLQERGRQSGGLHQAERELAGVGTRAYYETLCRALQEAEAVLVLNPFTQAMLSPYARRVEVVPWGMDPARFPWPHAEEPLEAGANRLTTIFQAGVVDEAMKGFHVLHAACGKLWAKRQDFELVVTGDPPGRADAWTRYTGWLSQEDLPRQYRAADIVAVPTIAQEGLSRTSVEAMASGKPVVASRIGGLPSTVTDGLTGLLCEPGNVDDLARKLAILLDDAELRKRMGLAGRQRFEADFTWDTVIERYYRPLLCRHPASR
jgi:glycosyltransferase involved in cell wall biosynthesis